MRINQLRGIVFGLLLFAMACSKSQDNTTAPHVYIGGFTGQSGSTAQGVVWKNGVAEDKPGTDNITAIAVSGSGVYVLQGNTYWKNGVAVTIPGIHTSSGIAVSGTDVYISCTTLTSDSGGIGKAGVLYWKNGTFVNLTQNIPDVSAGTSTGISVSGNDVYVSGSFFSPSYSPLQATYWKNGQLITLDRNAYGTKCITASGNDVYVASQTGLSTGEVIFKNGVMQKLGPHTKVYDIFLSGSDVYVAGFEGSGADTAIYWKNGQSIKLSGGWMTTGIFVNGNDVYCSGLGGTSAAVYWKNGVLKTLADPGGTTCIAVVP
jgi:hypothetical protein